MSNTFDWAAFLPDFAQTAKKHGFASSLLTDTDFGPLVGWERRGAGPRICLSSGIHGDEPAGPLALLQLMSAGFFTEDVDWVICPALNPTGLASGRRQNKSGVDLNRDYLTQQSQETQAHVAWIGLRPAPELFLSLHEDWETQHFYMYEINTGKDDPSLAGAVLDAVRPWFPPEPGPLIDSHTARGPGWIFHPATADEPHGWPEAIFLAQYGCPLSFTFETPTQAQLSMRVAAQCAAVRALCRARFPPGKQV